MNDVVTCSVTARRFPIVRAVAAALACMLAAAGPAAAQSISGASATTSGSTANSGDNDGSIRSSVVFQINTTTQLKTRYAWNISADTTVGATRDSNGTGKHNLSFNVTAPGGYRLDITQQRVGIMQRNSDASGCCGSADISGVTGSQTGGTLSAGTLNLGDPGSIGAGGGDANTPFNQTDSSAQISATSNGSSVAHALAFTWTGTSRSNSCEGAVRMGEGSSVSGCDACVYPGTPSRTQTADGHFITVNLVNLCGNGSIDAGEACDTALPGSCCATTCQFKTSTTQCRASAGVCDLAENCTGASATCPSNQFQFGTECRPSAGVCDTAEFCDGSGASCPSNQFEPTTSLCRFAAGDCDVEEFCTGSGANCPVDGFKPTSEICRGAADVCDIADHCTGSGPNCPADAKSSAVCRPSAGPCDVVESCDGVNDSCPGDDVASASTVCRGAAGVCDAVENCDGSTTACPPDAKSTAECRAVAGTCDVAESCDGVGNNCPADVVEPSTVECRSVAGDCDVAENCTGGSAACPADGFQPSTLECRASAGDCDVAENCTGSSASCPADGFQPSTLECRASAGECDVAENCTGSDATCPADAFEPASTVCRAATDVCDTSENCTGSGASCPADALEPTTTTCRPSAGDCDVAEACTGSGASCPGDAVQPATFECRADAGQCDVAENCNGTDVACPATGFEPDGTTCNDGNSCTIDDMCVSGDCGGNSMTCGDGTVQGSCTEECDDGNTDPDDGCSPTCQVEPGLGCGAEPASGCRRPFVALKASVLAKNKTPNDKDLLKWKWLKGERTTVAEYGSPLTTTSYQLCLYDSSGLRIKATIPPGGTCDGKPCWKAAGVSGYKYKNKFLTPHGVQKLGLKEGPDGKAKIILGGRGALLAMPDLSTVTQPVTVQLQNSDGTCWEAIYSAPPYAQSPELFKDKAD
jgi:cysteine-rich repeat protein